MVWRATISLIVDDRPAAQRTDRQDCRLRRVDHGREAVDAVHARFEMLNVPPASLLGAIEPSRTCAASVRVVVAISTNDFKSASKIVGTTSASIGGDGNPHIDARVRLELGVAVGAVHARELTQGEGCRLDDEVVEGRKRSSRRRGAARGAPPPRSCRPRCAVRCPGRSPATRPSAGRPCVAGESGPAGRTRPWRGYLRGRGRA